MRWAGFIKECRCRNRFRTCAAFDRPENRLGLAESGIDRYVDDVDICDELCFRAFAL